MITTLIFSKNRACQLEFCLRTLVVNGFDKISHDVFILYTGTTSEFQEGYQKLKDMSNNITWVKESDFESDTKDIINNAREHICFFVDDNLMYRPTELSNVYIETLMTQIDDAGCFSLRLGRNTIIQDPYSNAKVRQIPQFIPIEVEGYPTVLAWEWNRFKYSNFTYPFSVDGHIYNSQFVLDNINYNFDTPNALEGRFYGSKVPALMFCEEQSSIINNPMNLVGSSQNKAGVWYGKTLEELNTAFLDNYILQPTREYKLQEFVGCHQELETTLVKI